jgi:hypothetical protein
VWFPRARALVVALGASAALHAGLALWLGARAGWWQAAAARRRLVPMSIVEAPRPPPPPAPPPPSASPPGINLTSKRAPVPKPKPKPTAKPKPMATAATSSPAAPAALTADAGPAASGSEPGADAGPVDAAAAPDAEAQAPAVPVASATGPASAASVAADAPDAGVIDPGVIDLRPYVPGGERLMVVLRTDRLRATPWVPALDAILAALPDYQLLIAGTGVGVADAFDTVVIATPDPTSVPQTFLAAHTAGDEAALRRALGGPRGERVSWSRAAGGTLGRRLDPRVVQLGDPRLIIIPSAASAGATGWFLLARPEHVADLVAPAGPAAAPAAAPAAPAWLEPLTRVAEATLAGADGPVAVVMVADLGNGSAALPMLPPLPLPQRLTLAVTADPKGLVVTGAAVYADAAAAQAALAALARARSDALAGLAQRFLLRGLHAEGLVQRLALRADGSFVTFSSSVSNDEATLLLARAAELSHQFFRPAPPSPP